MAPPFVLLKNVARPPGPVVLHLPHDPYCVAVGTCGCAKVPSGAVRTDPKTGVRAVVGGLQQVPATITLQAKETAKPLPATVLACPDVAEAIAAKRLSSTPVPVAPEAEPASPTDAAAAAPAPKPARKAAPPAGGDA